MEYRFNGKISFEGFPSARSVAPLAPTPHCATVLCNAKNFIFKKKQI